MVGKYVLAGVALLLTLYQLSYTIPSMREANQASSLAPEKSVGMRKIVLESVEEEDAEEAYDLQEYSFEEKGLLSTPEMSVVGKSVLSNFSALLERHAVSGEIMMTSATFEYKEFTQNLLCSLRRLNITNLIVIAMDKETLEHFSAMGVPVFGGFLLGPKGMKVESGDYGSKEFNVVTILKFRALLLSVSMGYNTLFTDSDIVWLRDARPILREAAGDGRDMSFQCDSSWTFSFCNVCTGLFYVRPTVPALSSLFRVLQNQLEDPEMIDQSAMDWNLCGDESKRVNFYECIEPMFNTRVRMVPKMLLPNGDTFVNQYNISFVMGWNPYVMHFNWLHGRSSKLSWIKDADLWYLNKNGHCSSS